MVTREVIKLNHLPQIESIEGEMRRPYGGLTAARRAGGGRRALGSMLGLHLAYPDPVRDSPQRRLNVFAGPWSKFITF
ncbi:hypothetical protein EVAR_97459_1 [Eumeta japonica]|uniref:Uncharacterized protein n=1 Tax=Eumeta variegata TaxID=151549 RepID=A0A4C1WX57_EUMVA|nr:hypothetical protein EVAR_97459_1 [Eumeta japonica]